MGWSWHGGSWWSRDGHAFARPFMDHGGPGFAPHGGFGDRGGFGGGYRGEFEGGHGGFGGRR